MDAFSSHPGGDGQQESAFVAGLRPGLARLVEARRYARDVGRDPWEFAVDLGTLRAAGLDWNEARWLVCKGYVEHAREITLPGDSRRVFRPEAELVFHPQSRFVLTEDGEGFAESLGRQGAGMRAGSGDGDGNIHDSASQRGCNAEFSARRPRWNADLRELRVDGKLVKRFRVPSPNQERIVAAFEEEGWPPRIDDPLPPQPEQDSKSRLRDTIKSLNRHQVNRLLHITGDGTGQGICWEITGDDCAGRKDSGLPRHVARS
jgi:hypothetical protein